MQPRLGTKAARLSRAAWTDLLGRGIRTPEVEPAVRRRGRRYGAAVGTAWRILYQKANKVVERRGKLLNASAGGLMMLCQKEVPISAAVAVVFTSVAEDECLLSGEVRHCTSTVGGYKIGLRLHFADPDPQAG